jgi:NAD(P)-dependent dehydrogenase (short-subunit alcohol dehydrogenase family)
MNASHLIVFGSIKGDGRNGEEVCRKSLTIIEFASSNIAENRSTKIEIKGENVHEFEWKSRNRHRGIARHWAASGVSGAMLSTYSVYAATKGAVKQLTRQLAKEFGPKDIVINCIAPGQVSTELFLNGKSPELVDTFRRMNAFGRLGEPEDIANTLELLVSDKARWITGQTIRVNGGFN